MTKTVSWELESMVAMFLGHVALYLDTDTDIHMIEQPSIPNQLLTLPEPFIHSASIPQEQR